MKLSALNQIFQSNEEHSLTERSDNFRKNQFERSSNVNRKYEKIKSFDCLDKNGNIKIKMNKRNANSVMKKYKINNQNNISRNKEDKINNLSMMKKE